MSRTEHIPHGWGNDSLRNLIDRARAHAFGSPRLRNVFNLPRESRDLQTVDAAFDRLIAGWIDPEHPQVAMLVVRSFSALRGAAQLAMSGQLSEAYTVARFCLEHGLYGNLMGSIATRGVCGSTVEQMQKHETGAPRLVRQISYSRHYVGVTSGWEMRRLICTNSRSTLARTRTNCRHCRTMETETTPEGGKRFLHSLLSDDVLPFRLCRSHESDSSSWTLPSCPSRFDTSWHASTR